MDELHAFDAPCCSSSLSVAAGMGRRRWRFFATPRGNSPVREFLLHLPADDYADIVAAMNEVARDGLIAARHLHGDIYEVRASAGAVIYRVLFSTEGRSGHILLALEAFKKKTQKTPPATIRLAVRRLSEWRARARR